MAELPMGYYLDFVFEPETTRETVMQRIQETGGTRVPLQLLPKPLDEFWWPMKPGDPPPWIRATHGVLVHIYKMESTPAGNWAETRLSWGTAPDEWPTIINTVFGFADQVTCRVWDGQVQGFITRDNWAEHVSPLFEKASRGTLELVGPSDRADADSHLSPTGMRGGPPVAVWEWSVRTDRCLKSAGISNLDQLSSMSAPELLAIRNLGHKSLREIRDRLALDGRTLRDDG